jgi:chromobox protein 5
MPVESDDEMDVDGDARAPKKQRKASTQISKATKRKTATPEPEEKTIGTMESYMHMTGWDGLVKSVDTVERGEDDVLAVYFTL